jgi:23S rRNA C2498 (ribose-2'-O)-methylase RlmM
MDKRNNLNNDDKISILKRLIDTDIDNKIEISFYARDDNEFKTLMEFCRKQDLHEKHLHQDEIYWVYFHNGYDKGDAISANIQICIFEPR